MQLMHEYVQKSTSTTLPRNWSSVSGGLLCQRSMPVKAGAAMPAGDAWMPASSRVPANAASPAVAARARTRAAVLSRGSMAFS